MQGVVLGRVKIVKSNGKSFAMTIYTPAPWPRLEKTPQTIPEQKLTTALLLPSSSLKRDKSKTDFVRCELTLIDIAQRLGVRSKVRVGIVSTPKPYLQWEEIEKWAGYPQVKVWNSRKKQWNRANVRGATSKALVVEMCHSNDQKAIRISAVQEQVLQTCVACRSYRT